MFKGIGTFYFKKKKSVLNQKTKLYNKQIKGILNPKSFHLNNPLPCSVTINSILFKGTELLLHSRDVGVGSEWSCGISYLVK